MELVTYHQAERLMNNIETTEGILETIQDVFARYRDDMERGTKPHTHIDTKMINHNIPIPPNMLKEIIESIKSYYQNKLEELAKEFAEL